MKSGYTVDVFEDNKKIATVHLNEQRITGQGLAGEQKEMCAFTLVEGNLGNLVRPWNKQSVVELRNGEVGPTYVRVMAMPTEEGASGLIEFV